MSCQARLFALLLVTGALLWLGCVSDGAVRLARCVEAKAAELHATGGEEAVGRCDLALGVSARGAYVVAFPQGAVSTAQLESAGLDRMQIDQVTRLQLDGPPSERLNVLPAARRPRASRTTYHRRFVRTPGLLACELEGSVVWFKLAKVGRSIDLVEIAAQSGE